jgi:cytidyltransferase-like protein
MMSLANYEIGEGNIERREMNDYYKTKVGIFLGSFDPFHAGHKEAVLEALRRGMDLVWVVPSVWNPWKDNQPVPIDERFWIAHYELEKVENKYESTFVFSQYKASDRAMGLCYYTWLGDTSLVNREPEKYRQVTPEELQRAAKRLFRTENENLLIIRKK